MHNSSNPHQGDAKRVLCVCSAGLLRSPTASHVLHGEFGYNTRAVGVDIGHALIPIDDVLINWADEIVVMDEYQKQQVIRIDPDLDEQIVSDKIIVLNVPDNYEYMNEKLQEIILRKYKQLTEKQT